MISLTQVSVNTARATTILKGVSAHFSRGKVHALVGPNGSGKTTLLRTICKLQKPFAGSIDIDGRASQDLSETELAKTISWTESEHHSPFAYLVQDIILWGRWPHHQGNPTARDFDIAQNAAQVMGLSDKLTRAVTTLSLGERKKAHLAKSIASENPCLIWDEPCGALDVKASIELMRLARRTADHDKTVIMSLHDLDLALCFADEITILKDGYITWQGPSKDQNCHEALSDAFALRVNDAWGNAAKFGLQ